MPVYTNPALFGASTPKPEPLSRAAGPAAAFSPTLMAATKPATIAPSLAPGPVRTNPALTGAAMPSGGSFTPASPSGPSAAFAPQATQAPIQSPGNNLINPGYTEQAFETTQNRLLEDPYSDQMNSAIADTKTPTAGEGYLNQNLGALDGPGQGDQYWNQVQGQFNSPFEGEQFARQATQQMSASGPASAFFNQAQGQYNDFTGYSGPQNAQGQFGASSAALQNGTQGERGLGQIAGQYDQIGQYGDPNLAAGQYAQTQQAFGDLPVANFDPFYDRASQLGVQNYNRQAAGRGVYGSSEALSGVGNVITDIEAQRANRGFDAEMQRAQEQRARQGLLGEQARMGDLSSIAGFGANLAGAETFGNLNNMQANQELGRNQLLGNMANNADSQALGAQNANISGLNTFGNLSSNADSAETNRFQARTGAMNDADRTAISRFQTGADIAFRGDENARADYTAGANVARDAAGLDIDRNRLGADIASTASRNDLSRLDSFNNAAGGAENDRQARQNSRLINTSNFTAQVQGAMSEGNRILEAGDQKAWEDYVETSLAPLLQEAGYDQQKLDALRKDMSLGLDALQFLDKD